MDFHPNQRSSDRVAQITMQGPLLAQVIAAATTGASSGHPCSTLPDRSSPVPPPETGLLSAPQYPDGEHYGRSPVSSWKLHGNVVSQVPGESCFTWQRITSEGIIISTAGRTDGHHGDSGKYGARQLLRGCPTGSPNFASIHECGQKSTCLAPLPSHSAAPSGVQKTTEAQHIALCCLSTPSRSSLRGDVRRSVCRSSCCPA